MAFENVPRPPTLLVQAGRFSESPVLAPHRNHERETPAILSGASEGRNRRSIAPCPTFPQSRFDSILGCTTQQRSSAAERSPSFLPESLPFIRSFEISNPEPKSQPKHSVLVLLAHQSLATSTP